MRRSKAGSRRSKASRRASRRAGARSYKSRSRRGGNECALHSNLTGC